MKKFWNWVRNDAGERILRLEGPIDEDDFWGDEVTPKAFRDDLNAGDGDIILWVNSPGGNVFAAAEIYTMLRDYPGKVTVKIDAVAASAATVVAMAGDKVLMSPVAMMMLHDPEMMAYGNTADMEQVIGLLNEVKESILNAYAAKTGLGRAKIAKLMSDETWLNAKKAVQLGFADEILFEAIKEDEKDPDEADEDDKPDEDGGDGGDAEPDEDGDRDGNGEDEKKQNQRKLSAHLYSSRQMGTKILNRLGVKQKPPETNPPPADNSPSAPIIGMDGTTEDGSVPYAILKKQLEMML